MLLFPSSFCYFLLFALLFFTPETFKYITVAVLLLFMPTGPKVKWVQWSTIPLYVADNTTHFIFELPTALGSLALSYLISTRSFSPNKGIHTCLLIWWQRTTLSRRLTSFTSSPPPEPEHSPPPPTSGGREAVQESAVEPPVAADNMKSATANTNANILHSISIES